MMSEMTEYVAYYKCDCGFSTIGQDRMRSHVKECGEMPHVGDER